MPTSEQLAQRALARLPAQALAGLRGAFAEELSIRLPRVRMAARRLDPARLTEALRDVHTLGSSAYLLNEPAAGQAARAAEAALEDGRLTDFTTYANELDRLLTGWTA